MTDSFGSPAADCCRPAPPARRGTCRRHRDHADTPRLVNALSSCHGTLITGLVAPWPPTHTREARHRAIGTTRHDSLRSSAQERAVGGITTFCVPPRDGTQTREFLPRERTPFVRSGGERRSAPLHSPPDQAARAQARLWLSLHRPSLGRFYLNSLLRPPNVADGARFRPKCSRSCCRQSWGPPSPRLSLSLR